MAVKYSGAPASNSVKNGKSASAPNGEPEDKQSGGLFVPRTRERNFALSVVFPVCKLAFFALIIAAVLLFTSTLNADILSYIGEIL